MKTSLLSIGILTLFLMIGGNSVWGQFSPALDSNSCPQGASFSFPQNKCVCDGGKFLVNNSCQECPEGQYPSLVESKPTCKTQTKIEAGKCAGNEDANCDGKTTSEEITACRNGSICRTSIAAALKVECEKNGDKQRKRTQNDRQGTCDFKYYGGKTSRGGTDSKPMDVLNTLAQDANEDRIFDNQLNSVSRLDGGYTQTFKITNTLDSIRIKIAPYMQWAVFLGLSIAVLLIIYNGFLLVTNNVSDMKLEKAKSNIINILTGVAVLTGFYLIIRLVVSLLANFS